MRRIVAVALITMACESKEAKYSRLQAELAVSQLLVQADHAALERGEPVCPEFAKLPTEQYVHACDSVRMEHLTREALAVREMNRFMGSR